MADRQVLIGLASYIKEDSPSENGRLDPQWGFGLYGQTVAVHASDLDRFDRLNGPTAAIPVPLPIDPDPEAVLNGDLVEPARSGRGSGLEAWADYADKLGLLVAEGSSRDDIIALVDDSK